MADPPARLTAALADRYRLERELGQGGMATVYLAEDLKHHRKVALKVLASRAGRHPRPRPILPRDRGRRRAAASAHPPAARLGRSRRVPLLRHAVRGRREPARRLTREGELPMHEAVRLLAEVADALAYAHAPGRRAPRHQARQRPALRAARAGDGFRRGQGGERGDRPAARSPRRAWRSARRPTWRPSRQRRIPHLDHRVDIYALGVMAYELLAGRPPFTGASPQEVLAAHVTQPPELVSPPPAGRAGGARRDRDEVPGQAPGRSVAERPRSCCAQLEQQVTPSGGMTPTQTRPMAAMASRKSAASCGWRRGCDRAAVRSWSAGFCSPAESAGAACARQARRRHPRPRPRAEPGDLARRETGGLQSGHADGEPPRGAATRGRRACDGGALARELWRPYPPGRPTAHGCCSADPRGLEVVPALGGVSRVFCEPDRPTSAWRRGTGRPRATESSIERRHTLQPWSRRRCAEALARRPQAHSAAWSPDGRWIAFVSGNVQYPTIANLAPSSIWVVRPRAASPSESPTTGRSTQVRSGCLTAAGCSTCRTRTVDGTSTSCGSPGRARRKAGQSGSRRAPSAHDQPVRRRPDTGLVCTPRPRTSGPGPPARSFGVAAGRHAGHHRIAGDRGIIDLP